MTNKLEGIENNPVPQEQVKKTPESTQQTPENKDANYRKLAVEQEKLKEQLNEIKAETDKIIADMNDATERYLDLVAKEEPTPEEISEKTLLNRVIEDSKKDLSEALAQAAQIGNELNELASQLRLVAQRFSVIHSKKAGK
ncbi:MAG: hypothetical protein WCW87_02855 [Candidatus Paceibacterota bacterium]